MESRMGKPLLRLFIAENESPAKTEKGHIMSMSPNPFGGTPYPMEYEAGMASGVITRFFNAVYAWMAAGLALTALVAWYVSTQPQILAMLGMPMVIGLFVVELILVFTISAAVQRINAAMATVLFLIYAALNGVTLSVIFLVYAHATLASAFVIAAGTFGAMSLYGMVTRKDLSSWGTYLFMGLIGVVIASFVSLFWHSTMLNVLINYVGVLVFVGLTAYDTQKLKAIALQTSGNAALAARLSINGALMLYLDFLNLFLLLLRILGDRRN